MSHDNVIKWKRFPRHWPFVRTHRSSVDSPHKGQWRGALMFSLICAWTNGWANNRDAGDSRHYRVHYDVNIMAIAVEGMSVDCGNLTWRTSWWRHQMETFSALLALCAGNSPVPPHKGQWRGALMFSLICVWINGWVNNREAGDLRRNQAHYDVIVMIVWGHFDRLSSKHF